AIAAQEAWLLFYPITLGSTQKYMKPTKTRRELHQEMQAQVDAFLREGGNVAEIPRGTSGRPYGQGPLVALVDGVSQEDRTPLPGVVAAIEARKKPQPMPKARPSRPKKIAILDDFGQPIRWEWVDE